MPEKLQPGCMHCHILANEARLRNNKNKNKTSLLLFTCSLFVMSDIKLLMYLPSSQDHIMVFSDAEKSGLDKAFEIGHIQGVQLIEK